mgnify:FL=1
MREMKDSGIEWIGQIPKDWVTIRIGNVFSLRNERNYLPMEQVQLLSLYSGKGVFPTGEKGTTNSGNHAQTVADYKIVKRNDIVVNIILAWMGSLGISNYDGVVSPAYDVYIPDEEKVVPHYYHYVFRTSGIANECYRYGRGIMMMRWRTYSSEFKRIHVPFLPLEEQQQIADYLDSKCSEIDATAEDIQKEISLLEDYKKSVITEAVTKGLNPDAEMKDSGIEWIGEIPKHWKVARLKHVLSEAMKYGANKTGVEYSSEMPRYIRITDISLDGKLKDTGKLSLPNNVAKEYILKDKAILFARSGATVGKTFIYKSEYGKMAFAGYLISAYCNENLFSPELLYYFTNSFAYSEWINRVFSQSTIQNIGADKYVNMILTVPKIAEQQQIVSYLDSKCSEIDTLIADKKRQLDILADYKKSLIYEYVTGKKEVTVNE